MKGKRIETNLAKGYQLKETEEIIFREDESGMRESQLVNIYPQVKYQEIIGFGGAFTEAAAYTLSRMSGGNQKKIIDAYFGPNGIGYSFCRNHINSCDFSLGNYAYVEDPADTKLKTFDISNDRKYIIPMIKMAQAASKYPIRFMASPWSPPAFMKTTGQMNRGGKLKEEYRELWAQYVARYIKEYQKEGVNTIAVTVQNEPNATQAWDSCLYTGEEETAFVRDYLGPVLEREGLSDVKILIWDHNKERVFERASTAFGDKEAAKYIWGTAFHWYSGDHFEALELTYDTFPDKALVFTEGCVEYYKFSDAPPIANAEMYAHDYIGNLNHYSNGQIDWNMILDEKGGPNHVGNYCDAPVMCNTDTDEVKFNMSFYYIGQLSKFITPGSVRIGMSRYTDKLEIAAFLTPEGNRVVVALNRTDADVDITLRENNMLSTQTINAHSIATFVYA